MKNFFKKYIFILPTNFDHYSLSTIASGLIVIFTPFISCGPSKAELEARQRKESQIYNAAMTEPDCSGCDQITIQIIDSCEYIVFGDRGTTKGAIIHKANCRNPFHKNKN